MILSPVNTNRKQGKSQHDYFVCMLNDVLFLSAVLTDIQKQRGARTEYRKFGMTFTCLIERK